MRRREAGQEWACWTKPWARGPAGQPLWGSRCTVRPAPPEGRQRELGQLAEEGLGIQDFVSVPSASCSHSVSICVPAGTRGYLGCGRCPEQQQGHPPTAQRGQGYGRGACGGISRQQEPLLLSSEEHQLPSLAFFPGTEASEGSGCQWGLGWKAKQWVGAKLDLLMET